MKFFCQTITLELEKALLQELKKEQIIKNMGQGERANFKVLMSHGQSDQLNQSQRLAMSGANLLLL